MTTKNGNVVHKELVLAYPNLTTIPFHPDWKVVDAKWDAKANDVVVYVEKTFLDRPAENQRAEFFFVGTGHNFHAANFEFVATVATPDDDYFFHVYYRAYS